MSLEHNAAHSAEGLALPIYDLRQPLFLALLNTYLGEVQLLEDAAWQVYTDTLIFGASGDALDMLGELVGVPRLGRSDEVYRLWIKAGVRLSRSGGTPVDIYEIARTVLPLDVPTRLLEYFPGAFMLDIEGPLELPTALQIAVMLRAGKAAGVRIDIIYAPHALTESFTTTAAGSGADIDAQRGLADTAQTTGGKLVGVL